MIRLVGLLDRARSCARFLAIRHLMHKRDVALLDALVGIVRSVKAGHFDMSFPFLEVLF